MFLSYLVHLGYFLMRQLAYAFLPLFLAAMIGCQGSSSPISPSSSVAESKVELGAIASSPGLMESALGLYRLSVDPESSSATIDLLASRGLAANDDLYALSITNFLRRDSIKLRSVTRTATTLDVEYTFEHPFPAPSDPAGLPNGSTNRADLGIAGRLLVLADVASGTGNTYFTDVVANTQLVTNADAYYQPKGLLTLTAIANCFPSKVLVNESGPDGNRDNGIVNGGDPTGNFGSDGWTRGEFGATNDGWTGFGVLHQGQRSRDTISLALSEMTTGVDLTLAVLAKYNDPRGGTNSVTKRGNRLPPATPEATKFAYRMPHGALDVEQLAFLAESGGFEPNTISASTLQFRVVDWDARATETAFPELSEDGDVTTVAQGESGLPTLAVCIPGVLGDANTVETFAAGDLKDDDSAAGGDPEADSGRPEDALYFERLVSKAAGSGQGSGNFTGLARATDNEPSTLVIALDGTTLVPLTVGLPEAVSYQAFTVFLGTSNLPPESAGSIGLQLNPDCLGSPASFTIINADLVITDPESDAITYTVVATPDVGAPVTVSGITGFPISNAATGPFTNPATTEVTFEVYANDALHPGTGGTPLLSSPSPLVARIALASPFAHGISGLSGTDGSGGRAIVTNAAGDLFLIGYFTGVIDLDPTAGVDTRTSAGGSDIYVCRYDAHGAYVWGRTYGGLGGEQAQDLTLDASGNLYIAGAFQQTVDFDPGAGVANRSVTGTNFTVDLDAYGLSLDSAGNFRWVSVYGAPMNSGTPKDDYLQSVALDSGGNPVFVGLVSSTVVDLDPGAGNNSPPMFGSYDAVLWHLNAADGSFVRGARLGSTSIDYINDITFDSAGSMVLLITAYAAMDFDPTATMLNLTGGTGFNTFIGKYNSASWAPLWVDQFQIQIPSYVLETGLATDSGGSIYFSSETSNFGTLDLDPGPGSALLAPIQGVYDAFVVALNPDGTYRWHSSVSGPMADYGHGVAVADNRVIWGGTFTGSNIDFDPGGGTFLLNATNSDGFLATFDATIGAFVHAGRLGGGGYDETMALTATDECQVAVVGTGQATIDLDPGPGVQNRTNVGGASFLTKIYAGGLSF